MHSEIIRTFERKYSRMWCIFLVCHMSARTNQRLNEPVPVFGHLKKTIWYDMPSKACQLNKNVVGQCPKTLIQIG